MLELTEEQRQIVAGEENPTILENGWDDPGMEEYDNYDEQGRSGIS